MLVLLLLLATWFDGAFALRHWGPVAILALVISAAAAFSGAIRLEDRWVRDAVVAIFVLAGWSTLSAVWAESPGRALEGGARSLLYASLFFVAVATPGRRAGWRQRLGGAAVAGVGLIAAITLVAPAGRRHEQFLAGRLDDPVGYRNATACLFALAFWPFVAVAARQAGNRVRSRLPRSPARLLVLGLALPHPGAGHGAGPAAGRRGGDRARARPAAPDLGRLCSPAAESPSISGRLLTPYDAFTDDRPEAAADIATGGGRALRARDLRVRDRPGRWRCSTAACAWARGLAHGLRTLAAAVGAGVLALLAVVATVAAIGNPVTFASDRFDEFRSLETAAPGETRLTFGGGQRSDLWRVALIEFSDHPVTGVGEGSYPFRYYEERRTDRNLSTPHGLPFDLLAEKGVVGTLAFVAFLIARRGGGCHAGGRRPRPRAACGHPALLAAAAVVLGQSAVDWIWLIPGVTGMAFLCAGLALAALGPPARREAEARGRPPRVAGRACLIALAADRRHAGLPVRRERADGPRPQRIHHERLDAAQRAETLNPYALAPPLSPGRRRTRSSAGRAPRAASCSMRSSWSRGTS